jgi:apolipoprotein D and lipocalin family protein
MLLFLSASRRFDAVMRWQRRDAYKESAMKRAIVMFVSMSGLMMAGCVGVETRQPLSTVASVDLVRYAGTWYEMARLPMWFQRHCIDSKAVYTVRPDGKIGVHNECVTDTGGLDQVDGVATVVDTNTKARLAVTFDNFFARLVGPSREGNYWIIDLDPDYQTALVGTPDRRYLWILSRSPHLDEATYQRLVDTAQQLGFPVSELVRAKRSRSL